MRKLRAVLVLVLASLSLAAAPRAGTTRLIVHEWGTFTSVAGADGLPVAWRPLGGASDLPSFVHEVRGEIAAGAWPASRGPVEGKPRLRALVRMETPVLYFYADRPLTASVRVGFPDGWITEWYPRARSTGAGIAWDRVDVRPGSDALLPTEAQPSPYYEARETDAAPVSVAGPPAAEPEKFLFYRGVGSLEPLLWVRLDGPRLELRPIVPGIARAVVFESRDGRVGFAVHRLQAPRASVPRPALDSTAAAASAAVYDLLVDEGLYPREAEAMVDTWRGSWFEEGLRVLFVVPRRTTDAVLPLSLEPRPDELLRVLVARTEVVTPEMEESFRREIAAVGPLPEDARLAAAQLADARGRFAEPILRRLRDRSRDRAFRERIDAVIAASAPLPPPRRGR